MPCLILVCLAGVPGSILWVLHLFLFPSVPPFGCPARTLTALSNHQPYMKYHSALAHYCTLLTVTCLLTVACMSNEEKAMQKVDAAFQRATSQFAVAKEKNSSIYIVIPRAGCGGCISDAELFMQQTLRKSDPIAARLRFVLTDFGSEKTLKVRFGELFKDKRVVLDKDGIFSGEPSLKSIYPTIFFLDGTGKVIKVSSFSVSENGWEAIKSYVASR